VGFSVDSEARRHPLGLGGEKRGARRGGAIIAPGTNPFADLYDFIDRACCDQVNKKAWKSLIMAGRAGRLPGSRSQKLAALERAMDGAAKKRKENAGGPGVPSAGRGAAAPAAADCPPETCGRRLQMERDRPACTSPAIRWTNIRKS
jgi:DNA polymerase III alpha subunit